MRRSPSRFSRAIWAIALAVGCQGTRPLPDGGLPAVGPLGGKLVTTNQGDGTLSVIEPASGRFDGPILVPIVDAQNMEMAHEISADPAGRFFVVGLMEMPATDRAALGTASEIAMMNSTIPGWVLELSAADGSLVGKAQVDPDPGDNGLSADGSVIYVSCFNQPEVIAAEGQGDTNLRDLDGHLWAIDSATLQPLATLSVCPEPHVIELSADGRTLFVTCLNDEIAVVDVSDPRSPALRARVSEDRGPDGGSVEVLPSEAVHGPYALQASPASPDGGETVWVSDALAPALEVLDAQSLSFVKTLPMTGLPVFTTFNAAGTRAYNAHQQPDGIAVFDAIARTQIDDIPLAAPDCVGARQLVLSADETKGYVLCEGDHVSGGQYVILDLAARTVVSSTTIGIDPVEMSLIPLPPP